MLLVIFYLAKLVHGALPIKIKNNAFAYVKYIHLLIRRFIAIWLYTNGPFLVFGYAYMLVFVMCKLFISTALLQADVDLISVPSPPATAGHHSNISYICYICYICYTKSITYANFSLNFCFCFNFLFFSFLWNRTCHSVFYVMPVKYTLKMF